MVSINSFGQCTPDTSIHEPGIYPDSATGLPHAIVGIAYSTVIQLKVITDTTVVIGGIPFPATVDSIIINSVTGLPTNYNYLCYPGNCHFMADSNACILLYGPAPDITMVGQTFPLSVNVTAYGHLGATAASLPANVSKYSIIVDQPSGIPALLINKFEVAQNYPNPFKSLSEILFSSPVNESLTFKIANLLGKNLVTKTILANRGLNKIQLSAKDFNPGIYIYTLSNSRSSITRRMIVSNE